MTSVHIILSNGLLSIYFSYSFPMQDTAGEAEMNS